MIGKLYPAWLNATTKGTANYQNGSFVGLLVTSAYTYSTAHTTLADISPASVEVAGGNYTRAALTGMTIAQSGSTTSVTWAPITFPLITAVAANAPRGLIVATAGAAEAALLVLYQDFEAAFDANAEDVTITPNVSGLITYSLA